MENKTFDKFIFELNEIFNDEDINGEINRFINTLIKHRMSNVYIAGNGGSASNASHFAQDLNKAISKSDEDILYVREKTLFRGISLCDNVSYITAISNDMGYEHIFTTQLKSHNFTSQDLVVAISGSGNSQNIINLIKFAQSQGLYVFSLLGFDGGKAEELSNDYIHVKSNNMYLVESAHSVILHYVIDHLKLLLTTT